jgi:hypothetical protein
MMHKPGDPRRLRFLYLLNARYISGRGCALELHVGRIRAGVAGYPVSLHHRPRRTATVRMVRSATVRGP